MSEEIEIVVEAPITKYGQTPMWVLKRSTGNGCRLYGWLNGKYANLPKGAIPSLETLGGELGWSESTVKRARDDLKSIGALETKQRRRGKDDSRFSTNKYILKWEDPQLAQTRRSEPEVTDDLPGEVIRDLPGEVTGGLTEAYLGLSILSKEKDKGKKDFSSNKTSKDSSIDSTLDSGDVVAGKIKPTKGAFLDLEDFPVQSSNGDFSYPSDKKPSATTACSAEPNLIYSRESEMLEFERKAEKLRNERVTRNYLKEKLQLDGRTTP